MAIRPYKSLPLISFLFCVFIWTYFQPAFRLQFSGVASKPWSVHQLAKSFYKEAFKTVSPKKESAIKVKIDLGFVDFLKRLFPQKKQELNWKASAGLVLGIFIPINFLSAYLGLLIGALASLFPRFKKREVFFRTSFLLSAYALAGIWVLRERAGDLAQASLEQAPHGIFGFMTKTFVQRVSIEPGVALISLPILSASFWLLATLRRK